MNIDHLFELPPFSLEKKEKQILLNSFLTKLTRHHYFNCLEYKKMMDGIDYNCDKEYDYYDLPYLPVRLFKMFDLFSTSKENIVKTMTSSGTSGQVVSRIYLDSYTSLNQTKVLTKIVSTFIGKQRVPMIIIDSAEVVKNRKLFSARGAGILGFSMFGAKRIYALNEKMELDTDLIVEFLEKHKNERIFLFGFTFIVWQHFYNQLIEKKIKLDLSNAVLIHGGGWKKLINESISSDVFKKKLTNICGIKDIHDYYGMVEQTGSIYMECEKGHMHTPIYSDVIIRRSYDFSIASIGEKGIIQVVSILPFSYPGHSLLTEDEGVLLGEDDCSCGRLGKYFKIVGRLKNAEIRGCSDTYEK
jgi:phenylacetate-coenzyme A ligase PaaK-like adenylate-forming protein